MNNQLDQYLLDLVCMNKIYSIEDLFIIFLADSKFDFKGEGGDEDILYQWRLRRRLEQAQNGEPIIFPSKVMIIRFKLLVLLTDFTDNKYNSSTSSVSFNTDRSAYDTTATTTTSSSY
jgi:hypothetical protein